MFAHDVITTKITWAREISRFVYKHCASCHRDGGSSFALTSYPSARPWAKAIKDEVLERRMPPWGAVKGFGEFRDDGGLTQEDLELISDWVEGGAPEGDPALAPKPPEFLTNPGQAFRGKELIVDGGVSLKTGITVQGIRPQSLIEGASLQVVAQLPDGRIVPLLWLYQYKPEFAHPFYFRDPMHFPAGARIVATPASAGMVALLTSTPKPAR